MRIIRLDHVQISIPLDSEEEARRFYCELLGLAELPKPAALVARGGLWLAIGEQSVHFGTEDVEGRAASKRHVAFAVADLDEARRTLAAAGVRILEGIPIPGCQRIELRDPFGNRLELLQYDRPPRAPT